jgi:hypothetical protein
VADRGSLRTTFEDAIFAAAFVDALRNIYEGIPMPERILQSEREAAMVLEMWRKYSSEGQRGSHG